MLKREKVASVRQCAGSDRGEKVGTRGEVDGSHVEGLQRGLTCRRDGEKCNGGGDSGVCGGAGAGVLLPNGCAGQREEL